MNAKTVQIAALGVLAVVGIYYWRKAREANQDASAKGVTTTSKSGEVTTTPIKLSAVAIVAEPLRAIESLARRVLAVPAAVVQGGSPDRLQPYGSPAVAAAAYNAPLRPDYVPTIRAADNIVYVGGGPNARA